MHARRRLIPAPDIRGAPVARIPVLLDGFDGPDRRPADVHADAGVARVRYQRVRVRIGRRERRRRRPSGDPRPVRRSACRPDGPAQAHRRRAARFGRDDGRPRDAHLDGRRRGVAPRSRVLHRRRGPVRRRAEPHRVLPEIAARPLSHRVGRALDVAGVVEHEDRCAGPRRFRHRGGGRGHELLPLRDRRRRDGDGAPSSCIPTATRAERAATC